MSRDASGSQPPPQRKVSSLRPVFSLTLGLVAVAALWLYAGRIDAGLGALSGLGLSRVDARSTLGKPRFRPLAAMDRELLRRQRSLADDLARRHVGAGLTGHSADDLRVLQQILDRAPPPADETFLLQALGVALGDVMAAELGLSWIVYEDELGRSRALRLGDGDLVLFPVTMISRRLERGVPVRVDELYQKAVTAVQAPAGVRP